MIECLDYPTGRNKSDGFYLKHIDIAIGIQYTCIMINDI